MDLSLRNFEKNFFTVAIILELNILIKQKQYTY